MSAGGVSVVPARHLCRRLAARRNSSGWTAAAVIAPVVLVLLGGSSSWVQAATQGKRPPRIVSAVMLDANRNFRADRLRLTYSKPIRHRADRGGHYPFRIAGYRIRWVGAARGKSLLIALSEKKQPDQAAHPAIRYRSTKARPVTDLAGRQALAQLFRATRPHGHAAPAAPPAPSPAPTPTPTTTTPTTTPTHPSCDRNTADPPDLSFVDSNCDGIDGTETDAIFVSPKGNDTNPGTKSKPKREIQAALDTVKAGKGRYVLVAAGTYKQLQLATGVSIYGGYDPNNWSRGSASLKTQIAGVPQGVVADGATGVVLQLLAVNGTSDQIRWSAYGIRAVNGSALTLERVTVTAGPAVAQAIPGGNGRDGAFGAKGDDGNTGCTLERGGDQCGGKGGAGGSAFSNGGDGGHGGEPGYFDGRQGGGPRGGAGGKNGDRGQPGAIGGDGLNGEPGRGGYAGGGIDPNTAASGKGAGGGNGNRGVSGVGGSGGSGGGGGGGQPGIFFDEKGNGGGGGGGGGAGGEGAIGGEGGAGSFGIYLYNSILVIESSSIMAGNAAPGAAGGDGGLGGNGGDPGRGGTTNLSEVGRGGDGGRGGNGGPGGGGGGGGGGPSIGIYKGGTSKATVTDSTIKIGKGGAGGVGGGPSRLAVGPPPGLTGENGKPGIAAKIYPAP